ncbi:hypothetical protein D3C73_1396450 [compost metagenome]
MLANGFSDKAEGVPVSFKIQPGSFFPEMGNQLVIDQSVLGGHFRRGISGRPVQDFTRIDDGHLISCFYKQIGRGNSGNSGSCDKDIGLNVLFQRGK